MKHYKKQFSIGKGDLTATLDQIDDATWVTRFFFYGTHLGEGTLFPNDFHENFKSALSSANKTIKLFEEGKTR